MKTKYRLIFSLILIAFVLPSLSGCDWIKGLLGEGKEPLPFEPRESVRWTIVEQDENFCLPSINCAITMQLESRWKSGVTTIHANSRCCQSCERYKPACEIGRSVVQFRETNSDFSKLIKVEPHWPKPDLVIWTRTSDDPSIEEKKRKIEQEAECEHGVEFIRLTGESIMCLDDASALSVCAARISSTEKLVGAICVANNEANDLVICAICKKPISISTANEDAQKTQGQKRQ